MPSDAATPASQSNGRLWLDPGLPGVDCRHWVPYLTAAELGLDRPKLVLDFETGELRDDDEPINREAS